MHIEELSLLYISLSSTLRYVRLNIFLYHHCYEISKACFVYWKRSLSINHAICFLFSIGILCENEIIQENLCNPNPCQAGGSCIALAEGGFICKCTADRDGELCEKSILFSLKIYLNLPRLVILLTNTWVNISCFVYKLDIKNVIHVQ